MSANQIGNLLIGFGCCIWPIIFHVLLLWASRRMHSLNGFISSIFERFLR